jgi:hypothetical protein
MAARKKCEPKPVRSLASSLGAGRMESLIFPALYATCSQVTGAQITTVGFVPFNDQRDQNAVDVEKLTACVFMESGEPGPS